MKRKRWKGKLLAGILAASLVFQNMSVTALAGMQGRRTDETEVVNVQADETETKTAEVTEKGSDETKTTKTAEKEIDETKTNEKEASETKVTKVAEKETDETKATEKAEEETSDTKTTEKEEKETSEPRTAETTEKETSASKPAEEETDEARTTETTEKENNETKPAKEETDEADITETESDEINTTEASEEETDEMNTTETGANEVNTAEASEEETDETNTTELETETAELQIEKMAEEETEVIVEDLGGLFQAGSFQVPVRSSSEISTLSTEDSWKKWDEYIYGQLKERKPEIDISKFQISKDDIGNWFIGVINEHPDLYFVENKFSYSPTGSAVVDSIIPKYIDGYDENRFKEETEKALSVITERMSDVEKAIALHDYIVLNCEYDYDRLNSENSEELPASSYSAYGVLVERTAVCQGYALAYKYLLQEAGIECYYVSSGEMNHAWNMVKLDGSYYHVDTTWDDPVRDLIGRVCHSNMFVSDKTFKEGREGSTSNHHDWTVSYQGEAQKILANDTKYDDYFWVDVTSPLILDNDKYYYVTWTDKGAEIVSASLDGSGANNICDIGSWNVWNNNTSFYTSGYSGLFLIDGRLYFNTPQAICSVKLDGSDKKEEFKADTSNGYIYGSAYCQGRVWYSIHQSPSFEEKEEVLEAKLSSVPILEKLDAPTFSPEGGKVAKGTEVTLESKDEGVTIYYTTDNTIPDKNSKVYENPIVINENTTIKAVAVKEGYENSKIVSAEYQVEDNTEGIASGIINNISWAIDKDGNLTLEGTGDYSNEDGTRLAPPWLEYKDQIKTAKVNIAGIKMAYAMFKGCAELTEVDLTKLDTSSIEDMGYMFDGCEKLTELNLDNFKTENVQQMEAMFQGCSSLTALDLSNFATGNVHDMEAMFLGCSSLKTLDVSSFDTSKVSAMGSMFAGCSSLIALDISSFDTSSVTEEDGCANLLSGCSSLYRIQAPKNITYKVELPVSNEEDKWYTQDGSECKELPQKWETSIKLYKNQILENSVVVIFDLQGHGEKIDAIVVNSGEKVQKPNDPVAEGYTFDGWYKEPECQTAWNFDTDTVTSDMTLYAKWTKNEEPEITWTVNFNLQGHGKKIDAKVVNNGEKVQKPNDPEAEGYTFDGWYKEAKCQTAWKFDTDTVTSNITLYAKWSVQSIIVDDVNDDKMYAERIELSSVDGTIASIKNRVYNGMPYTPAVKVTIQQDRKKITLTAGTDYRVQYENCTDAGTGKVIVTGNGAYKGTLTKEFTITPKAVNKLKVVTGSVAVGSAPSNIPVYIYDGTKLLKKGTDYDFPADASLTKKKTSSAKVTITGKGNYKGTVKAKFAVYEGDASKMISPANVVLKYESMPYTGSAIKDNEPKVTVGGTELVKNKQYKVSYQNNKNAGTAFVIITGKGGYTGKVVKSFEITPIKGVEFLIKEIPKKTYNAKLQKPALTVKAGNKKLSLNKDYTVNYTGNLHAGTAVAKVVGIGNYAGITAKMEFTINPQKISKASVKGNMVDGLTLTYGKRNLIENTDYNLSYDEGSRKKNKIKVTISGLGDFAASTVTKTVKTGSSGPVTKVSPVTSQNEGKQDYTKWSKPVTSYLAANADGTVTRVEYIKDKVWAETYQSDWTCISQKQIKMELPIFGGFYAGTNNYFLVYGQQNLEEKDSTEVIRVVKYDKNWNRKGAASLYGTNTSKPFAFGSLRMIEDSGYLYVRTCRNMYKSSDGKNHQSNLTFSVKVASMKIIGSDSEALYSGYGYASHSFNQFIQMDGADLLAVDHGDAYPRSVSLYRCLRKDGSSAYGKGGCQQVEVLPIQGNVGGTNTGVSVGGLEVSDSSYLVAGNSVPQEKTENFNPSGMRNIFVTSTRKDNFTAEGTKLRWITSYTDQDSVKVSTPHLVKVKNNEFLLLWGEGNKVKCVLLDGDGKPTTGIYSMEGKLSDCQPILMGDCAVWYYTNNSEPAFFRLNLSDVR